MEHQKEEKKLSAHPSVSSVKPLDWGWLGEPSDAGESIYECTAALSADSLAIIGSTLLSSPWARLQSLRDTP